MSAPINLPPPKPEPKAPITLAQARGLLLWLLVALCHMGYAVGPWIAQVSPFPLPIGPAHAVTHAPAPVEAPEVSP